MIRKEYFETSIGQRNLFFRRSHSKRVIEIHQEPRSKSSMSSAEEIEFQEQIIAFLEKNKKRSVKSPVVLQLDFYPSQNNPPSIHQLAKNYLDLLSTPIRGLGTERKKLLYDDDRQVCLLVVNYHIDNKAEIPLIRIQLDTFTNFIENLILYRKIKEKNFKYDHIKARYDLEDIIVDNDFNKLERENEQALENLVEFQGSKDWFITEIGEDAYNKSASIFMEKFQHTFFKLGGLKIDDLTRLYPQVTNQQNENIGSTLLKNLFNENRKLIISNPFSAIDLGHAPTKKGDTKNFKESVRELAVIYKEKYKFLFPLHVRISLTIFYIPPSTQEIDLDNLARYIIPFINEALKPPSTHYFLNEVKGFPKHTVTQYQVIKIPRSDNDPHDGVIRLMLDENNHFESIFDDLDNVIHRWIDQLD